MEEAQQQNAESAPVASYPGFTMSDTHAADPVALHLSEPAHTETIEGASVGEVIANEDANDENAISTAVFSINSVDPQPADAGEIEQPKQHVQIVSSPIVVGGDGSKTSGNNNSLRLCSQSLLIAFYRW